VYETASYVVFIQAIFFIDNQCIIQGWLWLENKITENSWHCPVTFGIFLSDENSWNQLNNWNKFIPDNTKRIVYDCPAVLKLFTTVKHCFQQ
jgi:hypothetical protein